MASWFLLIGTILVLLGLAGSLVQRLPVSFAMIYLVIGWGIGPAGANLLAIDATQHAAVVEVLAEAALLVSLFAVGLKLRVPFARATWRVPLRLAGWGMLGSTALTASVAWLTLDLPWPAALLLGAVLSPTDPVLASDVQVRTASDRDAVRFSLTAEGALNDGMAFPMVMLALGLLHAHSLGAYGVRWVLVDLVWAVGGGLALGYSCGAAVRLVVLWLRRSGRLLEFEEFVVLGVIGVAYGVTLLAHAYGFLAVLAAALALNRPAKDATEEKRLASRLLTFTEQAERLCEVAVVLVVGALLAFVQWSIPLLVFVVLMLTLVRPVSVFAALPGRYLVRGQRRLIAWLGIRGVGSIYYMAYAAAHGIESLLAQTLFGIVVAAVGASILAHGISATPLMTWYEHRRARRRGVGPVDRAPP